MATLKPASIERMAAIETAVVFNEILFASTPVTLMPYMHTSVRTSIWNFRFLILSAGWLVDCRADQANIAPLFEHLNYRHLDIPAEP